MHDAEITRELEALRLPELQAKYAEVVGEPTRSPNKRFLIRKVVERMGVQELLAHHAAKGEDAGTAEHEEVATETADCEPEADVRVAVEPETTDTPAYPAPEANAPVVPAPEKKPRQKQAADETEGDAPATEGEPKLSKLPIEDLQALYREVIGRDTKSTSRGYLLWKIGQARKGNVPLGPRAGRGGTGTPMKVLPIRIPAAVIEPLDEARRRLNLRSRNDLFLRAVHAYLEAAGEKEVAGHFASAAATVTAE